MNIIVEYGGCRVADDGGEEDEGYDCVAEIVVCFELTISKSIYIMFKKTIKTVDLHMESMPELVVS